MTINAEELLRRPRNETEDDKRRADLGQFLTPNAIAELMASFFANRVRDIRLLDAGAGTGSLTAAFVRRVCARRRKPKSIAVAAYEVDPLLIPRLRQTLDRCKDQCDVVGVSFAATIFNEDFIRSVVPIVREELFAPDLPRFNAAIANPPYRKIHSDSPARRLLKLAGIETSNLYTGFVSLIARLLVNGGELVMITPRSFCNGPYFKPFRREFLETMSVRRLHVFESRSAAFSGDEVLQENVIAHAVKDREKPNQVIISHSSGKPGSRIKARRVDYRDVIVPGDPDQFFHFVVNEKQKKVRSIINRLSASLPDLHLTVSTGRVVDFRAQNYLRRDVGNDTAPLIYPTHFNGDFVSWPKENSRKPNAIVCAEETKELFVPAGIYVLVKRFTSKEERRRVVACIYDPQQIEADQIGFENHLNYFHCRGRGLQMALAKGLAAFLNSTALDNYFRQFSGHTQVNAADLRALKYPTRDSLEKLGDLVTRNMPQKALDRLVDETLLA